MKSTLTLVIGAVALAATGCATSNTNPNVLSEAPYNGVGYLSDPNPEQHDKLDTIQVTTAGIEANVLNTIPKLYKAAHEKGATHISNVKLTPYTKQELVSVPYESCFDHPVTTTENVCESIPRTTYSQKCVGSGLSNTCYDSPQTTYEQQCHDKVVTKTEKICQTLYRSEERTVLYQKGTADVYRRR